MIQPQMLEGMTEDVTRQIQQTYAGRKVRVFIEEPGEAEDLAADPPFTVRSREQLVGLLREGMDSPVRDFTEDTLERMRGEVRARMSRKRP